MVQIPEDEVTEATLHQWYTVHEQLGKLKAQEIILRNRIYKHYFVAKDDDGVEIMPREGTNHFDLADGYVLKADRIVNRTVDPAMLDTLKAERSELEQKEGLTAEEQDRLQTLLALSLDELVKWKPEVNIRPYRKLKDKELKAFEEVLIVKEGSPQLEIVKPKRL